MLFGSAYKLDPLLSGNLTGMTNKSKKDKFVTNVNGHIKLKRSGFIFVASRCRGNA